MRYRITSARVLFLLAMLTYTLAFCHGTNAQAPSQQEKTVKHFALIFRATRPLTPEELKQRSIDIAAWVREAEEQKIILDPRNLGETLANFSKNGSELVSKQEPRDPSLTTIVFFDTPSEKQAIDLARIHPGLRYGVTVEIREWSSPRESTAKP